MTYKSAYPNDGETSLYDTKKVSAVYLVFSPKKSMTKWFPWRDRVANRHPGPSTKFAGQRADGLADGAFVGGVIISVG